MRRWRRGASGTVSTYGVVLAAVAPVFLLLSTGLVLRRARWLTAEADGSLQRVVINLLYPALILDNLLDSGALFASGNAVLAPLTGFVAALLGFGLGRAAAGISGAAAGAGQRTFAFTAGVYNYGFIPIPLVAFLFPGDRDTAGVLILHILGVEAAVWTVGVGLLTGGGGQGGGWKRAVNTPMVALVVGVAANASGAGAFLPGVARSFLHQLSLCAIPLGLILSGAVLWDAMRGVRWLRSWRVPLGGCLIHLAVMPLLFLLAAHHLPLSLELRRVMVVEGAMPAGIFTVVVVKHYGGDTPVALQVIIASSLLSVLVIPLWISLGLALPGLAG